MSGNARMRYTYIRWSVYNEMRGLGQMTIKISVFREEFFSLAKKNLMGDPNKKTICYIFIAF